MVLKSFSSCIKKKEPRAKKKIFSQDVGAYIYVWIFENGVKELHPGQSLISLNLKAFFRP